MRGTKSSLIIRQGAEQNFKPLLYIEPGENVDIVEFEAWINTASETIGEKYPGVELKRSGNNWEVFIPDPYKVGHEAHFAQVTERFLQYLTEGELPDWEVPNMITKYNLTTQALELALKTDNK